MISVEIRGIYATALTVLGLEEGWTIARPSEVLRDRLNLDENDQPAAVTIEDREDKQGIILTGSLREAEPTVRTLLDRLPDALILGKPHPDKPHNSRVRYLLEFPSAAKNELDGYRRRRVFTLPGHHYLKIIDTKSVDRIEQTAPKQAESAAAELQERLVTSGYRKGRTIQIRHQKVGYGGFTFSGNIESFEKSHGVLLKRLFQAGGTYDSLGLPKEKDDFGTVEIPNDLWWLRRRYFAAGGELKGEIFNINTPAELYPDLIYYVDLELDVVRWPDGRTRIVDEEILRDKRDKGFVPARVADRARLEAERVIAELKGVTLST